MGRYSCTSRYAASFSWIHDGILCLFGLFIEILSKLKTARGNFDEPCYGALAQTPRQPSIFERELENPRLTNPPLTQPTPHAFDSAPMRPVSVAIQEGVGLFLNAPRSSVFGKFW